jgi:hypothetical protein
MLFAIDTYLAFLAPLFLVLLAIPVAAVVILRTIVRNKVRKVILGDLQELRKDVVPRCLKCGYDLRGLNYQRCPECGCLRGFTTPVEELPLTEEEKQLIDEKCRRGRED